MTTPIDCPACETHEALCEDCHEELYGPYCPDCEAEGARCDLCLEDLSEERRLGMAQEAW